LKSGGKLLVLLEPDSTNSIKPFLAGFGVAWQKSKAVLELNPLQQLARGNPLTPIVVSYDAGHEITREMKQPTLFPVATVVEKTKETPKDMTATSLMSTSSRSFEVHFAGSRVNVNQNTDRKGPLSLGVAVSGIVKAEAAAEQKPTQPAAEQKPTQPAEVSEKEKSGAQTAKTEEAVEKKKDGEFRLVVLGDSDFASNGGRGFGLNADLFDNTLSWLAQEEDLISIRPRSTDLSQFEITEQRTRYILLSSVAGAPLIMGILGLAVWVSRRRR
jgi:ABC-type uncharacterized transport system involved in gliding motility auxiliary subunit